MIVTFNFHSNNIYSNFYCCKCSTVKKCQSSLDRWSIRSIQGNLQTLIDLQSFLRTQDKNHATLCNAWYNKFRSFIGKSYLAIIASNVSLLAQKGYAPKNWSKIKDPIHFLKSCTIKYCPTLKIGPMYCLPSNFLNHFSLFEMGLRYITCNLLIHLFSGYCSAVL